MVRIKWQDKPHDMIVMLDNRLTTVDHQVYSGALCQFCQKHVPSMWYKSLKLLIFMAKVETTKYWLFLIEFCAIWCHQEQKG